MHIMIDLETLDTKPSAVILSIGVVVFDKTGIKAKHYGEPFIQEQINMGRTISESTMVWWMGQSKEAQKVFYGKEKISLLEAMNTVWQIVSAHPKAKVWGYGGNFDPVLIESAMRDVKYANPPWKYWDIRCLRTWCEENNAPLPKNTGVLHNAIDDAVRQAQHMIDTWNKQAEVT